MFPDNSGENVSIAILDSGVDSNRKEFNNTNLKFLNDCTDLIGHGTAVTAIISRMVPKANLYCYSLFDNTGNVTTNELVAALHQVVSYQHFDIIHLSCGVVSIENINNLYDVCKNITDTGTLIIAAFDNEGQVSYPAAFDNVIGVDWCKYCTGTMDYYILENSIVNVMGTGSLQRLPWLNNSFRYVSGSSFAAPYITGIVAKMLSAGIGYNNIWENLKKYAKKTINKPKNINSIEQTMNIQKAIVLPFNKEIQTLSLFEDMLTFEIYNIYDFPIFRNVGKSCREIIKYGNSNRRILSTNNINWNDDFDTVILGHTDIISVALGYNILEDILNQCYKHNKNIYAFDDIRSYASIIEGIRGNKKFAFFPSATENDVDNSYLGKLHSISTPVIAIFGTSSKQGKFSLQLSLRRRLQQIGYKVGGFGTEPSSLLFGFDKVYPIGYGSVHLSGQNAVSTINRYMHEIDLKGYDLIIVGSQSQTLPYNTGNLGHYPLPQHELFIGVEPDIIVLCINPFDDIDFVKRTVIYLDNYLNTKVLALVLFPQIRSSEWDITRSNLTNLDTNILQKCKKHYEQELCLPCFIAGNDLELDRLIDFVTDYFAE